MAALLLGLSLGLGAGISPGPLLTLVITSALERGFGAGLRVALAPLLTDLPIVLLTLWVLNALPATAVTAVTAAGGLFVVYLGADTMRQSRVAVLTETLQAGARRDLWRGSLVNALSPHPWLFWISVGSPLLLTFGPGQPWQSLLFLSGFYGLLVGSKVAVAWGVAGGRRYLTQQWYRRLLLVGGLMLVALGILLLGQALQGLS